MAHVADWPIHLSIASLDDQTLARVTLTTGDNVLTAEGVAIRNPHDSNVPEIGHELAAGRALAELARQLVTAAAVDVAEHGDRPVHLQY
jgi:Domain of unknown function (DUF1876)